MGLSLWRRISKTTILSLWLSGYFFGTSIFIGTTVSLVAILYCCGREASEKQRLPQKENLQEESLLLRTPVNIEWVRQAFVRSLRRSASRNVIALIMSDRTVRRILHENLNFHPYKMVMIQEMIDQDTVNRKTVRFCWTLWITTTLTTDEANFHLCCNNSQHCRYWAAENPRDIHQKPLHSEKFIVWCGVASFGVIGPYFFEDEAVRAVTVNSAGYTEMLRTFLEPALQRLDVEKQTLLFQQDRATAHSARTAMRVLTRCLQLVWSHEEGILNGLQDRTISIPATSYSADSSRARCTKWNQEQRWTWNRISGAKWQQFVSPCCNE